MEEHIVKIQPGFSANPALIDVTRSLVRLVADHETISDQDLHGTKQWGTLPFYFRNVDLVRRMAADLRLSKRFDFGNKSLFDLIVKYDKKALEDRDARRIWTYGGLDIYLGNQDLGTLFCGQPGVDEWKFQQMIRETEQRTATGSDIASHPVSVLYNRTNRVSTLPVGNNRAGIAYVRNRKEVAAHFIDPQVEGSEFFSVSEKESKVFSLASEAVFINERDPRAIPGTIAWMWVNAEGGRKVPIRKYFHEYREKLAEERKTPAYSPAIAIAK